MKLINLSLSALMALVLLVGCSPEVEENQFDTANLFTNDVENNHELALDVLEAINEYRSSVGLPSLSEHQTSEELALSHSAYMVEQNEASHDFFFQRSDYLRENGANTVAENVAFGFQSAQSALQGWLESPSHKAAIEGNFTHTGIAVVSTELGVKYYTQLFIRR
jgi:uncharacterized protein YkwD